MSEELQSLVQIIELYGRGLEGLGKAIRFSARGAEKGVQIAQVKALQHRMKLHYASEGTHNTMKLSDLEKMTGGRYTILNIPLEDEKELIAFYDRLKKLKVSFSELPDLNLGDGYTQIAYNPDDVESVRLVIDYYKRSFGRKQKKWIWMSILERQLREDWNIWMNLLPKDMRAGCTRSSWKRSRKESGIKISSHQHQCGIASSAGRKGCLSVSHSPWQTGRRSF